MAGEGLSIEVRGETGGEGNDRGLPRLNRVTLHEQVYQELRAAIRGGRFASGEVVTLRGLAEILGTSPMPVRDAVRRLVQDRALELLPNRKMRVPELHPERFEELTELRANVEGYAAALAAERGTNDEFAQIRAANALMEAAIEANDVLRIVASNERFHFAIYRAARSALLLETIDGLWQQSGPYLASLVRAQSAMPEAMRAETYAHHYELLAALARHDAEASRRAMAADIVDAARWYRAAHFASTPIMAVAP